MDTLSRELNWKRVTSHLDPAREAVGEDVRRDESLRIPIRYMLIYGQPRGYPIRAQIVFATMISLLAGGPVESFGGNRAMDCENG